MKRIATQVAIILALFCGIALGNMITDTAAHAGGTGGSTVLPVEYGRLMADMRQLAARDCGHQINPVAARYYQLDVTALGDSIWAHGYALGVPGYSVVHAQLCHLSVQAGGSFPEVPIIWGGDVARLLEITVVDCDTVSATAAARYQRIATSLQRRLDQLGTGITVPHLIDAKINVCNFVVPVG